MPRTFAPEPISRSDYRIVEMFRYVRDISDPLFAFTRGGRRRVVDKQS